MSSFLISAAELSAVAFDLDGTIYCGNQLIAGADKVVSYFRKMGKKVLFLTNNSTRTRQQICDKLRKLGVDCSVNEIVTSGFAAAKYLKQQKLNNVYVFGSENLRAELENFDLKLADVKSAMNLLIGYNPEMEYSALIDAVEVALKAEKVIACNTEKLFPSENGRLYPGCGAMVASIEFCCERKIDYIIGKPNPLMIDIVCDAASVSKGEILVIGDSYESDILMALQSGVKSVYIGEGIRESTTTIRSIGDIMKVLV